MNQNYCRSCFRPVSGDNLVCAACERADNPKHRWVLVLGAVGLPLLIIGMLTFNNRLCVTGAAISGIAALVYAVLSLR